MHQDNQLLTDLALYKTQTLNIGNIGAGSFWIPLRNKIIKKHQNVNKKIEKKIVGRRA